MNTSASFPREKIIVACKDCKAQIERKRQSEVDDIISYRMSKKRFFGFGRNYTKEEALTRNWSGGDSLDDLFWARLYGMGSYDVAEKILNLAEKSPSETITVTAEDFSYIKSFYEP